ncbi:MAG: MotE family protein [Rhizobiaceae bacterium]|jgi:flagellar motility protein MotE (MotC chaperone)|nr:MotE family protein [Rhizobiaceae bacterium]
MKHASGKKKSLLTPLIVAAFMMVPGYSSSASSIVDIVATEDTYLPEDLNTSDLAIDQAISEKLGVDPTVTGSIKKEPELLSYCLNIHDSAREARAAILTERLKKVEEQVDAKLELLAARVEELRTWTEKREKFLVRANESLVQIFQTMRADAAAQQLTEVGPAMAAAIISKLEPKYSSAIMTEMKPQDAAKIAMVLTNALGKEGKVVN